MRSITLSDVSKEKLEEKIAEYVFKGWKVHGVPVLSEDNIISQILILESGLTNTDAATLALLNQLRFIGRW